MFDYWEKLQNSKEEDVLEEIKKLHDKYFKLREHSPVRNQIKNMLDMAQSRYHDLQIYRREEALAEKEGENSVIEIGQIDSVEYVPDYTKEEILTHLSRFYYDKKGPIKQEADDEPAVRNQPEDTVKEREEKHNREKFETAYKELIDDIPVFNKKDNK